VHWQFSHSHSGPQQQTDVVSASGLASAGELIPIATPKTATSKSMAAMEPNFKIVMVFTFYGYTD
jgi:hypothetical protein